MTAADLGKTTAPEARMTRLRGNCMGTAMLLIVQFAVGTAVNLYVTVPAGKSFLPAVFSSALLGVHVLLALALLGAAASALVRAIRSGSAVALTSVGLAAILAAAFAGASFAGQPGNTASLTMALATAVSMACYLAAVFRLR